MLFIICKNLQTKSFEILPFLPKHKQLLNAVFNSYVKTRPNEINDSPSFCVNYPHKLGPTIIHNYQDRMNSSSG